MRITQRSPMAVITIAAVAVLGLGACSSGTTDDGASSSEESTPTTSESSSTPSTDEAMADPAADLVGSGCAAYAEAVPDGAGSIVGMSSDPVAVAASNNPLLTSLVAAVSGQMNPDVNLVDTLNGSEFTVFAPVDDAFAALDQATLDTLATPEGADTLTQILTYHVVPGQIAPDAIVGDQTTVQGGTVTVAGSGDELTVNGANVICGGVHTANATVYLIDGVLMPTM